MININMDGVLSLPSVPFQHKDFLPDLSGLYFVVAHTDEPNLVYIGQAQSFASRWKNHHREPEFNLIRKLSIPVDIFWLELRVSGDILDEWERKLIKQLNPAINDSLTMAVEIQRNEISRGSTSVALLPELTMLTDAKNGDPEESAESCPHCGSYSIKWLQRKTNRKQCKDCNGTWTVKD
jgi:hypothetical protein